MFPRLEWALLMDHSLDGHFNMLLYKVTYFTQLHIQIHISKFCYDCETNLF
jgi:hypothetical protein